MERAASALAPAPLRARARAFRLPPRCASALLLLLVPLPPAHAAVPVPQVPVGNIPLMPRLPSTYALLDWEARARAFVDVALANASRAAGMLDVYVSDAPLSSGRTVFDTVTYVGVGPKREVFPPLQTLLSAAQLGRRLDAGCSPTAGLDDCVATALQYSGDDGVIGHWVRTAGDGPTCASGGQLWDFLYGGILVSQVAAVYPDYEGGALGAAAVASARGWSRALAALGGGPSSLPDLNISGFNFSNMQGITDPVIYRQPSSSGGFAWLMMAALEWQRYKNASEPLPDVEAALGWSLESFDRLARTTSDFFENLVGFGALAAARSNAERNTTYDVGAMLALAFQDGSLNQKHGWGVVMGEWGGLDVSGLVGFVSEWDPSQPYGLGGNDTYFGDGLWLAGAVAPVARYNASFARAIGIWLVNLCSASRLFFEDQLPADHQTDAGDPRNAEGLPFPYEALRECDFVFEQGACVGDAHPFAMGDYGCDWPSGPAQPSHCNRTAQPVTNLAGYAGSSLGIAAALCAPTNTTGVLAADLLATDYFHAPAFPTTLVYNPLGQAAAIPLDVRSCALVHWAAGGGEGRKTAPSSACKVVDAVSGEVLVRGVVPPATVEVQLGADTAYVLSFESE